MFNNIIPVLLSREFLIQSLAIASNTEASEARSVCVWGGGGGGGGGWVSVIG